MGRLDHKALVWCDVMCSDGSPTECQRSLRGGGQAPLPCTPPPVTMCTCRVTVVCAVVSCGVRRRVPKGRHRGPVIDRRKLSVWVCVGVSVCVCACVCVCGGGGGCVRASVCVCVALKSWQVAQLTVHHDRLDAHALSVFVLLNVSL